MRFLHTSDWHIGKLLHGMSLLDDQAYMLDRLHEQLRDLDLDCLIIAGDIYDRSLPPVEAVSLFNETLTRFWKDFKKPVIIVSGNHDSAERLCFGSAMLNQSGIHLYNVQGLRAKPLILSDRDGDVAFCPVSYLEPATAREAYRLDTLHTHEASLRAACEHFRAWVQPGQRSVLICHAFVSGGEMSDSERPLSVGGSDAVSPGIFQGFNYAALGHLHKAQSVSETHIRYAGSPLKYSQSEKEHVKSFSIVDLAADGTCTIDELLIPPRRDLREVTGCFNDLMTGTEDSGRREDYVVVKLLDKTPILNAMERLRDVFPNLLCLERPGMFGEKRSGSISREEIARKSEADLFRTFAGQVSDAELSDEHMQFYLNVVGKLAREAD